MKSFWQDLRYALRMLAKHPGLTAVAVLTLGLGIGANSAIFSIVDTVLLQSLPYADPDRLVVLRENVTAVTDMLPLTAREYVQLREQREILEELSLADNVGFNLVGDGQAQRIEGALVTDNLFHMLGVNPVLGRGFAPGEERPGAAPVVILSNGLWRRSFGADPKVIGRKVRFDLIATFGPGRPTGNTFEVIGVLPENFRSPFQNDEQIWIPMTLDPVAADAKLHNLAALGRLRPEMSVDRARSGLSIADAGIGPEMPLHQSRQGVTLVPLPEMLVRNVRASLWILFATVGLVLLLACANVANLLLAQALTREREVVLRASLGAGRLRLVRQFLTESLLLGLLAMVVGLAIAAGLIRILVATEPGNIPRLDEIGLDGRVVAFTLLISVTTSLLFGLMPALRASRASFEEVLRAGSPAAGTNRTHDRLRSILVVAEIAVALLVIAGAGLLVRSFRNHQIVDFGFRTGNLLVVPLPLPQMKYPDGPQQEAFFRQALERARALPGVKSVGAANAVPLARMNVAIVFTIEGRETPGQTIIADYRLVSPGFLPTLGVPVLNGRAFAESDLAETPRVALINRAAARRYWPDQSPLEQRILLLGQEKPVTIVGVVGDVRHNPTAPEAKPTVYVPSLRSPSMSLVARTDGEPEALAAGFRRMLQEVDPELPVQEITSMATMAGDAIARPRFNAVMLSLLAAAALLLAMVGLYGLMHYSVAHRRREIGIRMVLGAKRGEILRLVLGRSLRLVLAGVILGLAAAWYLNRVLESQLYGVSPTDPVTFAGSALVLIVVAWLAAFLPARLATRTDPATILRQ
jgi:predicted permease